MKSNASINKRLSGTFLELWCVWLVLPIFCSKTRQKVRNYKFICLFGFIFFELRLENVFIIKWGLLDSSATMLLIKLQCLLVWWDAEFFIFILGLLGWDLYFIFLQTNESCCWLPFGGYFWAALAKAQQLLLDQQERDYILSQVMAAKGQYEELFWFILLSNHPYSSTWNTFQIIEFCCADMNWNLSVLDRVITWILFSLFMSKWIIFCTFHAFLAAYG